MNSAALQVALSDVYTRFVAATDHTQTYKLFCQIELAYWFYEDYYADKYDDLPHFNKLRGFGEVLFRHADSLSPRIDKYAALYDEFNGIRSKTPVAGCLLLNAELSKVVLVCSWNGDRWGFPKGKVEEGESAMAAAVREVDEETGFYAGDLVCAEHCITEQQGARTVSLFIVTGVPENTVFKPKTNKEISDVRFFSLRDPPKSAYSTASVFAELKKWIKANRKAAAGTGKSRRSKAVASEQSVSSVEPTAESEPLPSLPSAGLFLPCPFVFDVPSIMLQVDIALGIRAN